MKKLFLVLFFTAFATGMAAQDGITRFDVDGFVSVVFPGEVVKLDTLVHGTPLLMYHSNHGSGGFIVQKLPLDKGEYALGSLPYDEESLDTMYKEIASGFIKTAVKTDLRNGGGAYVSIGKQKAYSLTLVHKKHIASKNIFLILGNYIYIVSYMDMEGGFNPGISKDVFNSIVIKPNSPAQFSDENSPAFKMGERIGGILAPLFFAGIIVLIIFLVRRRKKRKTLINEWNDGRRAE